MKTLLLTLTFLTSSILYGQNSVLKDLANELLYSSVPTPVDSAQEIKPYNYVATINDGFGVHTTLYIGTRKSGISTQKFVSLMKKHIADVGELFSTYGLMQYSVYLGQDYEIAIQSWSSKAAADQAFASDQAKIIFAEAEVLLDHDTFEVVNP